MIEIRGDKKVLITPISEEDLADIKIGDIVWLDGDLMTCRDVAHRRLVEYGRELPYDIKDKAIFHAGPIVRKIEGTEDDYEMVSVGPTTSMRMEKFEYEFTKLTGVRVIVGKGGMEVEGYHQLAEGMIKLHRYNLVFVLADDGWSIILSLEHQKVGRQVFLSLYGFHRYRELLLGSQGITYISLIRSIGDDVGRRNLTLPQHWGSRSPLFAVLRHLNIIILQR